MLVWLLELELEPPISTVYRRLVQSDVDASSGEEPVLIKLRSWPGVKYRWLGVEIRG